MNPSAPRLVFLHGLESGPYGSKYQALKSLDPAIISPNCEGILDIPKRIEIIREALLGIDRFILIGSSFGGLAAVLFADAIRAENRVAGCLLCAPALAIEPGEISPDPPQAIDIPPPPNTIILHGNQDDVVPIAQSEGIRSALSARIYSCR